jgi:dihydrolipoamide dehydrogenase
MTGGLEMLARTRNVRFIQGNASFESINALRIESAKDSTSESIGFDYAVIATGSRPAAPPDFQVDGDRVLDSTAALNITDIPASMLVIGGGYIGLELGTVYAALGSRITVVEMESGLLPGADRDLLAPLQDRLEHTFDSILLNTTVDQLKAREQQVTVNLRGPTIEDGARSFDKVLIAVGRQPNTEGLRLEHAGVETNQRGFIEVNEQRQTTAPNIYAIGDVAGEPMLAHKAAHEAHVAVAAIRGEPTIYDPHAVPAVVFTDPEIAWCGLTESEARRMDAPYKVARFPWTASGRATTRGRNDGLTKLILEPVTERVLGFGITGVGAGELIAEGVLAIEMGARA